MSLMGEGACTAMKSQPIKQTISVCIFFRTSESSGERGIMIGHGDLIIDRNNKPVEAPVWSYTILWDELTVKVEL